MDVKTARELSMKARFNTVEEKIANSAEDIRKDAEKGRLSLLYYFDYKDLAIHAYDSLKKKHPDFFINRHTGYEGDYVIVISWE